MTKQSFDFSVPPEMRELAEKSVQQARQAFDGFVSAAEKAAAGFQENATAAQAGAKDIAQKAMTFAEQNVASSFDLAQKLIAAHDVNEVVKVHADYVRRQIDVLAEQARELGQTAGKAGAGSTAPKGRSASH
jgi:phasin